MTGHSPLTGNTNSSVIDRPLSPIAQSLQNSQADNPKPVSTPNTPSRVPQNTRDQHSAQLSPLPSRTRATPTIPSTSHQQAPTSSIHGPNNFEGQRSNFKQSPLNASAPAVETSLPPEVRREHAIGYLCFKATHFAHDAEGQCSFYCRQLRLIIVLLRPPRSGGME